MEIANRGYYLNNSGKRVDVSVALKEAERKSQHYHYAEHILLPPPPMNMKTNTNMKTKTKTKMYVCYSSILNAAIALRRVGAQNVAVLNSANGLVPASDKFSSGCLGLEACICRGSLLYTILEKFRNSPNSMYKINKEQGQEQEQEHSVAAEGSTRSAGGAGGARGRPSSPSSPSSCAIYSPNVPIIRRDDAVGLEAARFLDDVELCSFVSLPPPNAFVLGSTGSTERVRDKLREHIGRALVIFAANGCTDIVLCSYGCGSRGNDPTMVAEIYNDILTNELKGFFHRVIFAINPKKKVEYEAFAAIFEESSSSF